ncbi:MAG: hypothetical protein HY978_04565 [Candidatus Liptonbacteria bacterium]|nr:hypothetical protein [Candidatus Liptonbacteria bacterium]
MNNPTPSASLQFQGVVVVLALFIGTISVVPALAQSAPMVQTAQTRSVSQTSVTFSGLINPNGSATNFYFEYGPTSNFGYATPTQYLGSGTNNVIATASAYSLSSLTTYYYRLVAQNQYGTITGQIASFVTIGYGSDMTSPAIDTNSASNITQTSATIGAYLKSNVDNQTYAWFEYGTNPNQLTQSTSRVFAGKTYFTSEFTTVVQQPITNLTPGTTYYYHALVQNASGLGTGQTLSFTTWGSRGDATNYLYVSPTTYYTYNPASPNTVSTSPYYYTTLPTYIGSGYSPVYNPSVVMASGAGSTQAPLVTTVSASFVTTGSALLTGTVNPNGQSALAWFEYGPTAAFGLKTAKRSFDVGAVGATTFAAGTDALQPLTTYYFRAVAQNAYGTTQGATLSFQTDARARLLPPIQIAQSSGSPRIVYVPAKPQYISAPAPIQVVQVQPAPVTTSSVAYISVPQVPVQYPPQAAPPVYPTPSQNDQPATQVATNPNNQPVASTAQANFSANVLGAASWSLASVIGLVLLGLVIILLAVALVRR